MGARLVRIRGRLQSQGGVIHTVVEHIEDMTPLLGILQRGARRFGVSDRSDETLRPTGDHRSRGRAEGPALRGERMPAVKDGSTVRETASVMPRGRNFH
jgi:DNA polymerase-3 subunit alpha/error-prone DNA polymerase